MSEFAGGIPDESRQEMSKMPGGPFRAVFRAIVVIVIANLLIDLHAWLQVQFPGAPDYLLRLVVCAAFVLTVALVLFIGWGLFKLAELAWEEARTKFGRD